MSSIEDISEKTRLVATLAYRIALFLFMIFGAGVWLYSDAHNDKRYVTIETYVKDRLADNELRKVQFDSLGKEFSTVNRALDEIKLEIKENRKISAERK